MSKVRPHPAEGTFQMKVTARRPKITVPDDGSGIVSQAGALLLTQALRTTGLDRGLTAALGRARRCPEAGVWTTLHRVGAQIARSESGGDDDGRRAGQGNADRRSAGAEY